MSPLRVNLFLSKYESYTGYCRLLTERKGFGVLAPSSLLLLVVDLCCACLCTHTHKRKRRVENERQ